MICMINYLTTQQNGVLQQARRKWGGRAPHFLADQLTLYQPGGKHYRHPVLRAPPDFQTLRRPCICILDSKKRLRLTLCLIQILHTYII